MSWRPAYAVAGLQAQVTATEVPSSGTAVTTRGAKRSGATDTMVWLAGLRSSAAAALQAIDLVGGLHERARVGLSPSEPRRQAQTSRPQCSGSACHALRAAPKAQRHRAAHPRPAWHRRRSGTVPGRKPGPQCAGAMGLPPRTPVRAHPPPAQPRHWPKRSRPKRGPPAHRVWPGRAHGAQALGEASSSLSAASMSLRGTVSASFQARHAPRAGRAQRAARPAGQAGWSARWHLPWAP